MLPGMPCCLFLTIQAFLKGCRKKEKVCRPPQVYVWGRRHQYVTLSFLGIFNFTAPYLPWVLLGFSVVLGSSPVVDLLGMVAGISSPGASPIPLVWTLRSYGANV